MVSEAASAQAAKLTSTAVGLLPVATGWQRVLDAYLNTALDSPHSVRVYRRQCSKALERLGVVSLAELTGELLGRYRAEVVGNSKLAPAPQSQALDSLRAFLKWAGNFGAHGLDERIINASLNSPKSTVLRPYRILKGDETSRPWAAAAKRPMAYAALCVWLGAGLRVAEVAALRVQDCYEDLEGGPAVKVNLGKGSKDRIVPMLPDYFQGITNYLEATGRDLTSPGKVFVAQDRTRESRGQRAGITAAGLRWMLKAVMAEAGIESFRRGPHSFRHTYAMAVLREGGNVVAVSKLLGHASLTTTMGYVNHLELGDLRDALPRGGPSVAPRAPDSRRSQRRGTRSRASG